MHVEVLQFINAVKARSLHYFVGAKVLEAGSLNINGSVRQMFQNCDYTGVDICNGKDVDVVGRVHELPAEMTGYDTVISAEMLEHDQYWKDSLRSMYERLRPGGLMIITAAGKSRPEHGTKYTSPYDSPATTNYYENRSVDDILSVLPETCWASCKGRYVSFPSTVFFWAIKAV